MKRLILFFSGVLLLVLMFALLFFAGAIYDTGSGVRIRPYFFLPDNNFARRPDIPQTSEELGDTVMREMLISKYITELFYITPDVSETALRISGRTSLARMSTRQSFQIWLDTIAPDIEQMSQTGVLRTVSVIDSEFQTKTENGEYWKITYELKTWLRPNDFSVLPVVERGIVYLDIYYRPGMRSELGDISVAEYLESGNDPSAAFRFGVFDIVIQE